MSPAPTPASGKEGSACAYDVMSVASICSTGLE